MSKKVFSLRSIESTSPGFDTLTSYQDDLVLGTLEIMKYSKTDTYSVVKNMCLLQ